MSQWIFYGVLQDKGVSGHKLLKICQRSATITRILKMAKKNGLNSINLKNTRILEQTFKNSDLEPTDLF